MNIGEVSDRLAMPASTIRYYERIGLIARQRRVSGRRVFDDRAVFALQFVQLAQAAGFSISETKLLLKAYATDSSPGGMWKGFAEDKQADIRGQIRQLQQMDHVLSELLSCRCSSFHDCVEIGMARQRDAQHIGR